MDDADLPTASDVEQLQVNAPKSNFPSTRSIDARAIAFATKMLTYHRYTISFTRKRFDELGLPRDIDLDRVSEIDCVDQIETLCRIGQAVAREQVSAADFKGFLHKDE
jgi:hypothetical protein